MKMTFGEQPIIHWIGVCLLMLIFLLIAAYFLYSVYWLFKRKRTGENAISVSRIIVSGTCICGMAILGWVSTEVSYKAFVAVETRSDGSLLVSYHWPRAQRLIALRSMVSCRYETKQTRYWKESRIVLETEENVIRSAWSPNLDEIKDFVSAINTEQSEIENKPAPEEEA